MNFDEFSIGDSFSTEAIAMTKQEIIDFTAKSYHQYFHIDEEMAKSTPFGGLIASGFHTLSAIWAAWIRLDIIGSDSIAGLEMEHVKWKLPVSVDDELIGKFTVSKKRKLSDGKRGLMTWDVTITNQKAEEVLTFSIVGLIKAN